MYGNGVMTGTIAIAVPLRQIPPDLPLALTVFTVVVVGTSLPGTVGFLIASTLVRAASLITSACALVFSLTPFN